MNTNLDMIDQILKKEIDNSNTPSAIYYLFNKDSIIKKVQLGYADLDKNKSVDDRTFYKAFSATKTFTAIAILQLAEQGKLNLDDPIIKHLPNFVYGDKINIRQVLSHSAGIPNPIPLNWIHTVEEHNKFDRDRYFATIFKKHNKPKYLPNQKFLYSNLGYFLLGQLIENTTGMKYENYIEQNIIHRIGLDTTNIDFNINSLNAIGYNNKWSFANLIIGWFVDKSKYMKPSIGKWKPYTYFYPNGASYAGLVGTPKAFVVYLQALLKDNSALISNSFKQQMFTENINSKGSPTRMCLGWFTDQLNGIRYFAHPGGAGGYYCELRIYPEKGIGSVIFFNRTGMSNAKFLDRIDKYFFPEK
jgi:CubicO group peptidase (beta-lactamase class C family)